MSSSLSAGFAGLPFRADSIRSRTLPPAPGFVTTSMLCATSMLSMVRTRLPSTSRVPTVPAARIDMPEMEAIASMWGATESTNFTGAYSPGPAAPFSFQVAGPVRDPARSLTDRSGRSLSSLTDG